MRPLSMPGRRLRSSVEMAAKDGAGKETRKVICRLRLSRTGSAPHGDSAVFVLDKTAGTRYSARVCGEESLLTTIIVAKRGEPRGLLLYAAM